MPFTFAHPGAVLPFKRFKTQWLDITALVIGSLAPDFEYFIHFRPYQVVGHTLMGQVYLNLPLVFIVAYLYHHYLKPAILLNLPKPFDQRYAHLMAKKWSIPTIQAFFVFSYSALLGMASHLFLDAFTHSDGYFVSRLSVLQTSISIFSLNIPLYKLLQHGGTLIGFTLIIYYLAKEQCLDTRLGFRSRKQGHKLIFWIETLQVSTFVAIIAFLMTRNFSLGGIIVTLLNAMLLGLLIPGLRRNQWTIR